MRRKKITAVALFLSLAIAAPVLATTEYVGGGYWNYGSVYSPPLGKHVYSQYTHNTKTHTA